MKISVLLFLPLVLLSCTDPETSSDHREAISAITEMSKDRAAAFNAGDAVTIALNFTENGVLMAPGKPVSKGRKAVEEYYASIFDEFETILESHYEEVEVAGDLGFGRWEAKVTLISRQTGDTTYASSKYLNIVKKQPDCTWKTTHDIWNENGDPSNDR